MKKISALLMAVALTAGAAEPTPPATAPAAAPPAAASSSQSMEPRVDTSASPARAPSNSSPVNASAAVAAPATPGTVPAAPSATAPGARDRLDLETTQITGNRELPRVMYVVPWKRADLGDLTGRPVNSLLDEVLAPVDRDVFRRQNRYYDALRPDTAGKSTGAP